jgi:transposase
LEWIDRLRWQRLGPFQKLPARLLDHLDGILNYCRGQISLGVGEAVNGSIKAVLSRGRGYRNLGYILLKAQLIATRRTELVVLTKAA